MLHKVKTHRWKHGILETAWDFFEDLEEALVYANSIPDAHQVKVYTEDDQLVHHVNPTVSTTYA